MAEYIDREAAISILNTAGFWDNEDREVAIACVEQTTAADVAPAKHGLHALRPVSREQVERMRGEWVAKHRHRGGFRRVTGVDDMGEQRTITIDERCEYDDRYCSKCGKQSPDNFLNFCGYCGAPMTDEAVDMVMERLEGMHGET